MSATTEFVTEAVVAPVATMPAAAASATEGGSTVMGSSTTPREEVKQEIAAHEKRLSHARKRSAELQKELREIDGCLQAAKSEEQSNGSPKPQLLMLPSQQRLIRAAEENAQNAMRQRRLDITVALSNIDKEVLGIERDIKLARQRLAGFAPPTVVVKPSPATSKKLPKKKQVPPVAVAVSPAAAVPTVLNAETRAKVLDLLLHKWGYVSHRTGGKPLTADKMRNLPLDLHKQVSFEELLGSVIRADEEKTGERSYPLAMTLDAWIRSGGLERESNVEFREMMKLPPLPVPVASVVQVPVAPPVKPSAPVAPVQKPLIERAMNTVVLSCRDVIGRLTSDRLGNMLFPHQHPDGLDFEVWIRDLSFEMLVRSAFHQKTRRTWQDEKKRSKVEPVRQPADMVKAWLASSQERVKELEGWVSGQAQTKVSVPTEAEINAHKLAVKRAFSPPIKPTKVKKEKKGEEESGKKKGKPGKK